MDYNKFEDRISDWIENSMDIKERKEFEQFLTENPEYQKKVDSVRKTINIMKTTPSLKTSENFDKKLQDRINALSENKKISSGIMGFSRQNFVYLTLSVFCIFMLSAYLLQPSQSNYFIADEDTSSKEALSNEDETEIKDVELLNDVNGSFVSDKD
jgi:hypothetical protein|tara:strand:- start:1768 stop:2235 length:468 start_codon:yes stop_codon:yes gene_type:complete